MYLIRWMSCIELLNETINNLFASKSDIKRVVNNLWLAEGGAPLEVIEAQYPLYTRHLHGLIYA